MVAAMGLPGRHRIEGVEVDVALVAEAVSEAHLDRGQMQGLGELEEAGGQVRLRGGREPAQFLFGEIVAADLGERRGALGGGIAQHDLGDVVLDFGGALMVDGDAQAFLGEQAVELPGMPGGDFEGSAAGDVWS